MHTHKQFAIGLALAVVALLTVVPIAGAADIEGTVTKVDMAGRVVTLDDGTALKVMNAAQLRDIKPGASVKASYEERNGEKIATSISVAKPGTDAPAGVAAPSPTPPRSQ